MKLIIQGDDITKNDFIAIATFFRRWMEKRKDVVNMLFTEPPNEMTLDETIAMFQKIFSKSEDFTDHPVDKDMEQQFWEKTKDE